MKSQFEIFPDNYYEEDCSLLCLVSFEGVYCTLKNVQDQKYIGVAVYQFEKSMPKNGLHIALQILFNSQALFSKKFQKTTVVYSFPESVLIPFSMYDSRTSNDALTLLYGDLAQRSVVYTDIVTESAYYNCYRVPEDLNTVIEQQFPDAHKWHNYSALLGSHSAKADKMYVSFYSRHLVVTLFAHGKCQLVNTFAFQSATDAVYFLLASRSQSGILDIEIEVSGFIEENSNLHNELHKYFQKITFTPLPDICDFEENILEYPEHYFSHLFALDTCG